MLKAEPNFDSLRRNAARRLWLGTTQVVKAVQDLALKVAPQSSKTVSDRNNR